MSEENLDELISQAIRAYEEARYLDAYRVTKPLWSSPEIMAGLSVKNLIDAGRLAFRLGGSRLRANFHRRAIRIAPTDPYVKYFTNYLRPPRNNILHELSIFLDDPELDGADSATKASWLASYACAFGYLRDFDKAHELIEKALTTNSERSWIRTCQAHVFMYENRWQEAYESAKISWEMSPGTPFAASILGQALGKLGQIEQAVDMLLPAARNGQSYETLITALWYCCAMAERMPHDQMRQMARTAYDLSERLYELVPLCDKHCTYSIEICRMDAASLLNDTALMGRHAGKIKSLFYRTINENISKNSFGQRYMTGYRPVFQQYRTCLPASISSALGGLGVAIEEKDIASEITYSGTPIWLAADWLRKKGFSVKPFIVTPDSCRRLIRAGLPFVICKDTIGDSHAMTVVGYDEAMETIILHDPSSVRLLSMLIDHVSDEETPLGPEGLAVAPPEKSSLLDLIEPAETGPEEAYLKYRQHIATDGPTAASQAIGDYLAYNKSDFAKRIQALLDADFGRLFDSINAHEELLARYPNNVLLQRELMQSLRFTGDSATVCRVLEDIVEKGKLPGITATQKWRYPSHVFMVDLANYVGLNAQGFDRAERLINRAIRINPSYGKAYHILGDIYSWQAMHEKSLLPLRIACLIDNVDDHYARAYSDALRRVGKESEGVAFLRKRAEKIGISARECGVWMTLVLALESYGRPQEAIETMENLASQRSDDADLSAFAVKFWSRMGMNDRARGALESIVSEKSRYAYLESAVIFHMNTGDWRQGLELCKTWIREFPASLSPKQYYLDLYANEFGNAKTLELARQYMLANKDNEHYEDLYITWLRELARDDEEKKIIRARLDRNPRDAYAWQKLGHIVLSDFELLTADERKTSGDGVEKVLDALTKLCPGSSETLNLNARYAAAMSDNSTAVELLLRALQVNPTATNFYDLIWDQSNNMPREEQLRIRDELERRLLATPGQLHGARKLAFLIARRFGFNQAEESVNRWVEQFPDDPELDEARADLLVVYGKGRSDAVRAIAMLQRAIIKYPNHFDLRLSIADAYEAVLDHSSTLQALEECLKKYPLNSYVRGKLANGYARAGRFDEAVECLKKGIEVTPLNSNAWTNYSDLLWDNNRRRESNEILESACAFKPESVYLREKIIKQFQTSGEKDRAIHHAKELVAFYPDGAYCWHLLAEAMEEKGQESDINEIERLYKKALECNARLYVSAERLARLLARKKEYDAAREVLIRQIPLLQNPAPAKLQLAQLTRQNTDKEKALEELLEIVRQWPSYSKGWSILMNWLGETKDNEKIIRILSDAPPAVGDDPLLESRRLEMLQKAGLPQDELDGKWTALLANYPGNETVYETRFDILVGQNKPDEAAQVLVEIEKYVPESPFVLARKVRVFATAHDYENAVNVTLKIWFQAHETASWPIEESCSILENHQYLSQATKQAVRMILEGKRIRYEAFQRVVKFLHFLHDKPSFFDRLLFSHDTLTRRQLQKVGWRLLLFFEAADWDDGRFKSEILEQYAKMGLIHDILKYVKHCKKIGFIQTPIWQAIGGIFTGRAIDNKFTQIGDKNQRWMRDWLSDWRDRPGVEMWTVANYTLNLRRLTNTFWMGRDCVKDLFETSRDALERLAFDHCALYLACVLCETALRLNKINEFMSYMDKYRNLMEHRDTADWMPNHMKLQPQILGMFEQLVKTEGSEQVIDRIKKIRALVRQSEKIVPWVNKAIANVAGDKMTFWQKLFLLWW